MRTCASSLLCLSLALRVMGSDSGAWATVPSVAGAPVDIALTVERPSSEDDVRFVGPALENRMPTTVASRRVLSWAIPSLSNRNLFSAPEAAKPSLPQGARWPDSHGVITVDVSDKGNQAEDSSVGNPWEVRIHPKSLEEATVFTCGGIIAGGEEGPVAILNERVVMKGDNIGEFSVAQVRPDEVLLERNGAYFVIPRGRRTTVEMAVP
jgi:hypothetical protein